MEKGKVVKVSYSGYVNGKLFDTTDEELAKKERIFNPRMMYGPLTVIVGNRELLPGLDEALLDMEVGEERELELPPEKAFGKRDPSKVKLVPYKEFRDRNIKPIVGLPVTIDGNVGKIVKVSGGRVLVDFNHEFAGKTVKYILKIEEVIEEPSEIVKEIIDKYLPNIENIDKMVEIGEDEIKIIVPERLLLINGLPIIKIRIAGDIFDTLGISKVSFVEEIVNPKKADENIEKDNNAENNNNEETGSEEEKEEMEQEEKE